jgi:TonB family protein
VVNEQGNVEDAHVIRGIGGGADEEALRVVRQAKFKPGMQRGRPVRVQFALPIMFKVSDGGEEANDVIESPALLVGKELSVNIENEDGLLSGQVLDGETKEPLAGANVILASTNSGTVTNINGEFSMEVGANDTYEVLISYVGFKTASLSVSR